MALTFTKHFVVDLQTGLAYGLKMDSEGKCHGAQALELSVVTTEGSPVVQFRQPQEGKGEVKLPYGKTTYAVELAQDGTKGYVFTIVWPSKADIQSGIMPTVAKKELPADFVKAGLAQGISAGQKKIEPGKKGAGIDDEYVLNEALKSIDGMIGLDQAKRDIKQNIAIAQFNRAKEEMGIPTKPISRHMVFTGNPGTGKTTFAREVAKVYHSLGFIDKPTVHEVKREDLVAGYVGQTAIKTKEAIDKAKGGILFIDEAYALSRGGQGSGGDNDFGREAIDTLVAAMENMREELIVIVAGYTEPMKRFIDANEGLKSRFMTYIDFQDYAMPQLGQILDVMLEDRGYKMDSATHDLAMKLLQEEKTRAGASFGNGRSVRNLVEKAEKELALRLVSENKLGKNSGLSDEERKAALTTITLKDIEAITLAGLDAKGSKQGITFSFKMAANDDQPKAPVNAAKKGKNNNGPTA